MDTLISSSGFNNVPVVILIFGIILTAILTLLANSILTRIKASYDFSTHAKKFFFEKKLDTYSSLIKSIQELLKEYNAIDTSGIEEFWKKDEYREKFHKKSFELNKFLELSSIYIPKELCVVVDQFFRFSICQSPEYDKTHDKDPKTDTPMSIIRRNKVRGMIEKTQTIIGDDMKKIGLNVNVYLVREPPPKP